MTEHDYRTTQWHVLRHVGNGTYETLAYAMPALTSDEAALKAYKEARKLGDAERWSLLVFNRHALKHIDVGLVERLRP